MDPIDIQYALKKKEAFLAEAVPDPADHVRLQEHLGNQLTHGLNIEREITLLSNLLQAAKDLKYFIDIQPKDRPVMSSYDPSRYWIKRPVCEIETYKLAEQAIREAEAYLTSK